MNLEVKLQIATLIMLLAAAVSLLLNTCAMDRLERQIIRNTLTLEKLTETAATGGGAPARKEDTSDYPTLSPGDPTGYTATGWGGRTAEILAVEGAIPNPPHTLAEKPRPQNDTYRYRRNQPPADLSFYLSNDGNTARITEFILGTMLIMDPDQPTNVTPGLATRWEVSQDQKTYTYHLRKGVRFADGRPFTSADVLFTFNVVRDPAVRADAHRSKFDDVESLEVPDPYTVVVKYRREYWRGIYAIGFNLRILNKGWYEEEIPRLAATLGIAPYSITPGEAGFGEVFNNIRIPCPGTGPYYFGPKEYDPKGEVLLVQNPFYYGIQVHPEEYNLRRLQWLFIPDDVAAFEALRKEEIDVTAVDFQSYDDEYGKDPTITSNFNFYEYFHTRLGYYSVVWNNRKPPFDETRVRLAMTHLTNREWIRDQIERGRSRIATCPTKPGYPSFSDDLEPHPFDLERARGLLRDAGWTDSDGDGILDRNGQRFEFELKVGPGGRFYTQVGAVLRDACEKVGIRMVLRQIEWSTLFQDAGNRSFDAICLHNGFIDPWVDVYEDFHSSQDVPGGLNLSGWHNARADRLLEAMRTEFDEDKRNELFHEFNHIFYDEQPYTLLVYPKVGALVHKRFEGREIRETGLEIVDLWVKPENVLHK